MGCNEFIAVFVACGAFHRTHAHTLYSPKQTAHVPETPDLLSRGTAIYSPWKNLRFAASYQRQDPCKSEDTTTTFKVNQRRSPP